MLIGLGIAAIHAGHQVRYFIAANLVDTLSRGRLRTAAVTPRDWNEHNPAIPSRIVIEG